MFASIVSRLALVTALAWPAFAVAQQVPAAAAPDADGNETIVVTGSRITASGYTAATPVTVVGEDIILRDAKVTIGDAIRELPAVGASASPNNGSGAGNIVGGITGLDTVNLRQSGVVRTLVLLDGQRVVQSNVTGQVDIGTMPTILVKRIDVVTGGASAAWGSDAVAGVVNLVLNREFDGLRASVEAGESAAFDQQNYRFQAAWGTGFDGGKGRLIVAGNHLESPDVIFNNQRSWFKATQLVNNPAFVAGNGQPRFIHADGVGLSRATTGGLITSGPASLVNRTFVPGSNSLVPLGATNVSGGVATGGNVDQLHSAVSSLTTQFKSSRLFGYGAYEAADWLRVSLQLNWGQTWSRNNSVPYTRLGNITVQASNPFLPAEITNALTAPI